MDAGLKVYGGEGGGSAVVREVVGERGILDIQAAERKWSKLPNGNGPNCRMAIDVDRHNLV